MDKEPEVKCECGDTCSCKHGVTNDATTPEEMIVTEDSADEILAPLPSHVEAIPIEALTLSTEFPIHSGQENESKEEPLPPETFDVDKKLFLVYRPSEGADIVFDGHHHFRDARASTRFVSSKIQKDRLVLVKPMLNCRVFCESEGWTRDAIKVLSQSANFEGKKAIVIEPNEVTAVQDGDVEIRAITDCLVNHAGLIAIEDSVEDGILGYLTQYWTIADRPTKWGYTYQSQVIDDSLPAARERVRLRTMHSEMWHPQLIANACDKHGCGPKFVDNPDAKTATPVAIYDRQPDGWVVGKRAILDSPKGRAVWAAAKSGNPYPLSVRWVAYCPVNNRGVPSKLELVGVDDVDSPAVEGAGTMIAISDSFDPANFDQGDTMTDLSPQGPSGKGEPFYGVNHNTCNPEPRPDNDPVVEKIANGDSSPLTTSASIALKDTMNPQELLKLVRGLASVAGPSATRQNREKAYLQVTRAITDAYGEGLDVSAYVPVVQRTWKALADEDRSAAYHSGVRGPYVELGNMMEMDPKSGWAPDLRDVPEDDTSGEGRQIQQHTDKKVHDLAISAQGDSKDEKEDKEKTAKKEMKAKEEAEEEEKEGKMDSFLLENQRFGVLDSMTKKMVRKQIWNQVKSKPLGEVTTIADSILTRAHGAQTAASKLANLGFGGGNQLGNTQDPSNPTTRLRVNESRPGAAAVEKLLAVTDDLLRAGPMVVGMNPINPDNENTKTLRAYNIKKMSGLMDFWEDQAAGRVGKDRFYAGIADSADADAIIVEQAQRIGLGDSYTSSLSSVPNQPTIFRWMLTQAFQDQRGLAFVSAIGPGQRSQAGPGWDDEIGFGSVFRIPYESYVDPSGNGFEYGGLDFSLLLGENQGIPEGSAQLYWDTFFPYWRMNATSSSIQAIKSIGNGPLNYALGARNIWHMLARKSRSIDQAIFNEMGRIPLEYGAVAVSSETYTTGNHGLANQTAYQNGPQGSAIPGGPASTAVVINLNPTKIASAAVTVGTDDYACYPNPNVVAGTGGTVPIAGLRLLTGTAVNTNASPYFGTRGNVKNPVVPQRVTYNINSAGSQTTATVNPITVTAPASQVQGYLGPDGYIYSLPNTTATWALDPMNGVVLFNSLAGLTVSGVVVNTTITMGAYSYATNFDVFPLTPGINGLAGLATGETPAAFNNRLLAQFDFTGGVMASWPRFVAPDLAVMSATVSPNITEATAFYKLNSPKETDLYPSEEFYATRNGVDLARINTPWFIGDTAILETRRFSTKYAIDTPAEVRGPAIKYDASGNFIPGDGFYMAENSAILTPQTKNLAGTVINPVARVILLLSGGQTSCGIPY